MQRDFSTPKHRRSYVDWGFIGVIALIVIAVAGFIIWTVLYLTSQRDVTCTVEEKDHNTETHVSSDGDGNTTSTTEDVYRVYTTDCGIFVVEDNWLLGQFNNDDTYASLKSGETYTFHVVGWRVGWANWYPNILSAKEA